MQHDKFSKMGARQFALNDGLRDPIAGLIDYRGRAGRRNRIAYRLRYFPCMYSQIM
jgi:hypothetical protein